jgi:cytochrome c-type biogenesis protein
MGVLKIPWLYRTYQLGSGTAGGLGYAGATAGGGTAATAAMVVSRSTTLSYARSAGFGASFAVAWTPCIGPVLGSILLLAASSSTVHQGAYLLLAYSAGLALPFLVTAYALSAVTTTLRRYHHLLPALEVVTGAIVVVVGILVFLNEFTSLNQYFDLIPELNTV